MKVDARWNWKPAWDARNRGRQALGRSAEALLAEANREVPVATGALRASGRVLFRPQDGRAVVYYDVPYAQVVHERMGVHHSRGRAKWLELAAIEDSSRFQRDLQSGIGSV
jgi:hypothetical protein